MFQLAVPEASFRGPLGGGEAQHSSQEAKKEIKTVQEYDIPLKGMFRVPSSLFPPASLNTLLKAYSSELTHSPG